MSDFFSRLNDTLQKMKVEQDAKRSELEAKQAEQLQRRIQMEAQKARQIYRSGKSCANCQYCNFTNYCDNRSSRIFDNQIYKAHELYGVTACPYWEEKEW